MLHLRGVVVVISAAVVTVSPTQDEGAADATSWLCAGPSDGTWLRTLRDAGAVSHHSVLGDLASVSWPGSSSPEPLVIEHGVHCRPEGRTFAADLAAPRRLTPRAEPDDASLVIRGSASKLALPEPPHPARHYDLQWYLHRAAIPSLWSEGGKQDSVTVAILDTGVAPGCSGTVTRGCSADLRGVRFVPGWDFINDDADPRDDNQHGTFMASVIAARGGIVGVAEGVRVMPVKVLDHSRAGTELALIEGLRYATRHGADVINLSLSFPLDYRPSAALAAAVREAAEAGVVLVSASGNEGASRLAYPAAFPEVIAVGATRLIQREGTLLDSVAPYANLGPGVDVLAPGGDLDRDENGDSQPDGILAMTHDPSDPNDFGYWFQVGTSPAAALVAGVAAQLLARGCSGPQVRSILRRHGRLLQAESDRHIALRLLDGARAVEAGERSLEIGELGPPLSVGGVLPGHSAVLDPGPAPIGLGASDGARSMLAR